MAKKRTARAIVSTKMYATLSIIENFLKKFTLPLIYPLALPLTSSPL
jgi:hypothetical protein